MNIVIPVIYKDSVCGGKGRLPTNSNSVEKGVILSLFRLSQFSQGARQKNSNMKIEASKDKKLVNNNFVPLEDEIYRSFSVTSQLRDVHHSDNA